jgi:steroid 5-alpha reductase family enzyme
MMLAGWIVSLVLRNVTVVDSLWGTGFVIIAWITHAFGQGYAGRSFLLALLTTMWGLRLSVYLTLRNRGHGEDPRYGAWRAQYGENFWIVSLFNVFLIQALVLWVVALALQYGQLATRPAGLTAFDAVGVVLWFVGMAFETVADLQLYRFKSDPANRGKVMDRGLWAYSRHPNYFGEALVWWGIYIIAAATPHSWWTIISPVLITVVLLKVTGVALTEKTTLEKRPAYRDYIARTSAFFPWFPKKDAS